MSLLALFVAALHNLRLLVQKLYYMKHALILTHVVFLKSGPVAV
jgi:hypothetical protein